MSKDILILILGMTIVTYLPRLLPLYFFSSDRLNPFLKRVLYFIPYAVLGALIFPAILYSTDQLYSALFGAAIAIVIAYFELNLFLVVLGGVGGVLIWQLVL